MRKQIRKHKQDDIVDEAVIMYESENDRTYVLTFDKYGKGVYEREFLGNMTADIVKRFDKVMIKVNGKVIQ